jgi:hypothetical protein
MSLLSPTGFLVPLAAKLAWATTCEKMPGALVVSGDEIRTAQEIGAILILSAFFETSEEVFQTRNRT